MPGTNDRVKCPVIMAKRKPCLPGIEPRLHWWEANELPISHRSTHVSMTHCCMLTSDVVGKNNNQHDKLFPLSRMNTCTKIMCTSLKVRFGLQLLEEKEKSFRGGQNKTKKTT